VPKHRFIAGRLLRRVGAAGSAGEARTALALGLAKKLDDDGVVLAAIAALGRRGYIRHVEIFLLPRCSSRGAFFCFG